MYYKQRKMEAKNQLIFNRIVQLPVAKAITDKAISTYQAVKNHNRLFNSTLQLTENVVKFASETSAAKMVLESNVAGSVNQVAVNVLDKVESSYPVVKKTPDELWKEGENYYNGSWLKPKIDLALTVKDYGMTKITTTKNYYQSMVTDKLDAVLDYTEAIVDKYVVHGDANGQAACAADASYFTRVSCISGKVYHSAKHRTGEYYNASWVKPKVDSIIAAKDHGLATINQTKDYFQAFITNSIDGALDYTDAMIDKYIIHSESNGQVACADKNASYYNRVSCIVGKLYYGLKHRTSDVFTVAMSYALDILGNKQHKQ